MGYYLGEKWNYGTHKRVKQRGGDNRKATDTEKGEPVRWCDMEELEMHGKLNERIEQGKD
jgi:hypothetical protein